MIDSIKREEAGVVNPYMEIQIRNMILASKNFHGAVTAAASKDDGKVDPAEEKTLKEIKKAVEQFTGKLEKLL